jgi:hypothetical protein
MVDLGPIEEDVPFAWGAAAKLRQQFTKTAAELRDQAGHRKALAAGAKEDWRGRYARLFESEHMAITIGDANRIAEACDACEKMLGQLVNLAREEQQRRETARAWKTKHDAWVKEQSDDGIGENIIDKLFGDDEPKPPDLEEIKPKPLQSPTPAVHDRG